MSNSTDLAPLEAAASMLAAAGYAAYSMTLVGHPAPIVESYRNRASTPQPGDLVFETSTYPWRSRDGRAHELVGTLVRSATERIVVAPTDIEPDGWEYDELAWYVDPFVGGETVRWTNAEFVAIPRTQADVRDWQARA